MEVASGTPRGRFSARRLTAGAIVTSVVAVVMLVVAAGGGEGDGGSDSAWVAGLLLLFGPTLLSVVVHSVAASTLLRPIGAVLTLASALLATVHVAIALDGSGPAGALLATPAIATPLLLLAAVVAGPARRRGEDRAATDGDPAPGTDWTPAGPSLPDGPPLDVGTPLRSAQRHALRSLLASLFAIAIVAVIAIPFLRLAGWPEVAARLDASVISVAKVEDGFEVVFRARGDGSTVTWRRVSPTTAWEVGEALDAVLDEDGNVHLDQQFGLAGLPLLYPVLIAAMMLGYALRRSWALAVALWDFGHGDDVPRLGFAALVDDPAPRTWRPLLAVWDRDPTVGERIARPDAVYRADDETGQQLLSDRAAVRIHEAWIDTGPIAGMKPRWVGVEDGIAIPHRRSLFGSWYVGRVLRRSRPAAPTPMRSGPPDRRFTTPGGDVPRVRSGIGPKVAWRVVGLVLALGLALLLDRGGAPADVQVRPGLAAAHVVSNAGEAPDERALAPVVADQLDSAAALMRASVVVIPSRRSASRSGLPVHLSVSQTIALGSGRSAV